MKVIGWILIVFGVLNLIVGIIGASQGADISMKISASLLLGGLGTILVVMAKRKEKEEEEKDKWNEK